MIDYRIIKSKRKTISLIVNKNLEVIVRAPNRTSTKFIDQFVKKNILWIEKNIRSMNEINAHKKENALSEDQRKELKLKAKEVLSERVKYYSSIMNVRPCGVKITSAKTRWGSCSYKNSLCLSYRAMLLPIDLIDSIIVHELAHINIKNHSSEFYNEIYKYMPDYDKRSKEIRRLEKQLPY